MFLVGEKKCEASKICTMLHWKSSQIISSLLHQSIHPSSPLQQKSAQPQGAPEGIFMPFVFFYFFFAFVAFFCTFALQALLHTPPAPPATSLVPKVQELLCQGLPGFSAPAPCPMEQWPHLVFGRGIQPDEQRCSWPVKAPFYVQAAPPSGFLPKSSQEMFSAYFTNTEISQT